MTMIDIGTTLSRAAAVVLLWLHPEPTAYLSLQKQFWLGMLFPTDNA